MKRPLLLFPALFIMLTSFGPDAELQQFKYQVYLDGRPIGTHTISKTAFGESIVFKLEDNAAAGLIRKAQHRFEMLTSFDNERLISSDMKSFVDGKLETSTTILWDGTRYVRQEGDHLTEMQRTPVTFSSPCMFFEEPMNRQTLFYEKFGTDLPVCDLGSHRYEVKLPSGAKERYTYKDGEVIQVDLIQTFATISLMLDN